MTIAVGVSKTLRYKKQSVLGTAVSGSGAQVLRRVTSDIDLSKDTYQSNEIRPDMQVGDFRHGMWKIGGGVSGELSPATYKDLIQSGLRRDFAAVSPITGASITIAGSGPTYTVTRAAGSFLTDGIKTGMTVRLSAGAFNAANIAKNLFVLSVVALVLTVMPVNGVALVAEGPIATSTVTATGKYTYIPAIAHGRLLHLRTLVLGHFAVRGVRRLQDQHARIRPAGNGHVDVQGRRDGSEHDGRHGAEFHLPDGGDDDGLPGRGERHSAWRADRRSRSSPA
jgi:hypothetical protein